MEYTYLHDLSIIEIGKKYNFRLMPDNRSVTGTVILVEVDPDNVSKGKIHTENNSDRFYVGEYQYLQYSEYSDEIPKLFSSIVEFRNFVKDTFREGVMCEGMSHKGKEFYECVELIVKNWLVKKGIDHD